MWRRACHARDRRCPSEALVIMITLANDRDLNTTSEQSLRSVPAAWRVLWTKPRQEKAVARFLNALGVHFYLPLVSRVSFVGGRKLRSNVPLFPSYVFLAAELEVAYAAVSSKRVCKILEIHNQAQFTHEIEQIRQALLAESTLDLYPFAVVGRHCRVTRGPFQGIEGVVSSRLGPSRLALQIRTLGQTALLEIDADLLEPI